MNRRAWCRRLAWSTLGAALPLRAQPVRPLRLAWVSLDSAADKPPVFTAFRAGMAELGYVEGRNLAIDAWWGEGSVDRLTQLRGDILRALPEIIVAQGGVALGPMRHASVDRPVVFSMSADPVAAGVAASYARPGGKLTGITLFAAELVGKRMAMLKELVPRLRRIAVIANPLHPGAERELQATRAAAAILGLDARFFPIRSVAELDAALAETARDRLDGAVVFSDGFALGNAERIAAFSLHHRIPVVAGWAPFAQRGNVLAYGPEFADVYRRLASYVDRIHRGAAPGELPIEQPTKIELVINLKTARALGLKVPRALLLRADQVIE